MGFERGQRVKRRSTGVEGVVMEALGDGYYEVSWPSGSAVCSERDLVADSDRGGARAPAIDLLQGRTVPTELYTLYLQSTFLQHAYRYDDRAGLSSARIEPQLHQIYVLLQVLRKLRPRMILADEVGLGKTIEAGLIIKELRARGLADRVLIVCPANLLDQWQAEMESKFNEHFKIYNRAALSYLRGKENPWELESSIICSLPFATRHRDEVLGATWDLVIFDEAHKLNRRYVSNKWDSTKAWELADELKERTEGLLLLTATPMQLDPSQFYSLLELIEPGLFGTLSQYEEKRKEMPKVSEATKTIEAWGSLTDSEKRKFLEGLARCDVPSVAEVVLSSKKHLSTRDGRDLILDELIRKHPLAGVMVRNRKCEIGGFKRRYPKIHQLELSEQEMRVYEDIFEYVRNGYGRAKAKKKKAAAFLMVTYQKMLSSSSSALAESFRRRLDKLEKLQATLLKEGKLGQSRGTRSFEPDELRDLVETSPVVEEIEDEVIDPEELTGEIDALREFIRRLNPLDDTKAREFLRAVRDILDRNPKEKVLVFTQFLETQRMLVERLEAAGYRVCAFNGRMNREAKEAAVSFFRDSAQVMVSTEAGGEGRNFQFCHIMFNYDLPWNPMRLEQRIGRLDRIGQKRDIEIHNFATKGTVEERVLDVMQRRIRLFEESIGGLDPILGEVEANIEKLVMQGDEEKFHEMAEKLEESVKLSHEREQAESRLAIDPYSWRRDQANKWLGRKPLADWSDLERYVDGALDYFGGRLTKAKQGTSIITLSPELGRKLRTRTPTYTGAFDPEKALAREEVDFFAIGHELIDRLLDLPATQSPLPHAGFRKLAGDGPPVALEVFWEIKAVGKGRLERLLRRGQMIRHEVVADKVILSERVDTLPAYEEVVRECSPPEWAERAIETSFEHLKSNELATAEAELDADVERIRADELERARRIHEHRKERILARISDHEEWLARNRESASEKVRKIIPAREGQLAKAREDLESLDEEYKRQIGEIEHAQMDLDTTMIAAGVVIRE